MAPGTHLELLVIIAVMNHHEAQVETPSQVEEVVCLGFGPCIVVEIHLVLLLRVDGYLHRLSREEKNMAARYSTAFLLWPAGRGQKTAAKSKSRRRPKYQAGTARTLIGRVTEQAEELIRNNTGSLQTRHSGTTAW